MPGVKRPIGYVEISEPTERPRLEVMPTSGAGFKPVRPSLQKRSSINVRRHGYRSLQRGLVLAVLDALAVILLAALADVFRRVGDWPEALFPPGFLGGYRFYFAIMIGLAVTGCYGRGDTRRHPGRIYGGVAIATAMALWSPLWHGSAALTILQFFVVSFLVSLVITVGRLGLDRRLRARKDNPRRIPTLLVGPVEDCIAISHTELFRQGAAHSIVGFVTPDGAGPKAIGSFAELGRLIPEEGIETVFLAGSLNDEDFAAVVDSSLAADCEILAYPRRLVRSGVQPSLAYHDGMPLLQLHLPSLRAWQLGVKRVSDIIGGALLLVLLSPIFAAISLAILVTSGRPIFYSQRRVGIGGRVFTIHKFRSMEVNADVRMEELREGSVYADPRLFKLRNDPRVTRLGGFLRRTSLDELPQLWNVMKGDMALVGPRPPRPEEVVLYEEHHYCRFDVRPGMTGPWQVSGRNLITDFEEVIRLEQNYIRRWSIFHDLRILIDTIPAVLRGRGAH